MSRGASPLLFAVLFLGLAHPAHATGTGDSSTPSSAAPGPSPPYVTPEMYGAVGNGVADDHVALNKATEAACTTKTTLFLDRSYYIGSTTWNMTSAAGCNGGLTVMGNGENATVVTYLAPSNNVGIAWDMTGASYVNATGFQVTAGTPRARNSPKVTLLLGAAYSGGFIFSGIMHFTNVFISNAQGSWVIADEGAEQLDFDDCIAQSMGTTSNGILFVSSGSTPPIASALVGTFSPVQSMTEVHWHGAKGALLFYGYSGVVFHFTRTGQPEGIAAIHFDDFVESHTPVGTQFSFMADDAAGAPSTLLTNIGSSRLTFQNGAGNGAMVVGSFGAAKADQLEFDGAFYWDRGAVVTNPFVFGTGTTLTNSRFYWNANNSGAWKGTGIVQVLKGAVVNGVDVRAPYPKAMLLNGGGTLNSYIIQGTDGTSFH